jgi:hypothetical protein
MHFSRDPQARSKRANRRLLWHLRALGGLVEAETPAAEERLLALLGEAQLGRVRARIEGPAAGSLDHRQAAAAAAATLRASLQLRAARMLSRVKRWQLGVFFVSLACGSAVGIIGLIDLIWRARGILGGLGAVAIVLTVYLQTRQHRVDRTWIGS